MSGIAKSVSLCLVFIGLVLVAFYYSKVRTPQLSEEELASQGVFLLDTPREIAPFSLSDASGGSFDNARLLGRWNFIFFGFTNCPDICPTSMAVMGQADQVLRQTGIEGEYPFQGILISVDPERDTLEKLQTYATAFSPRFVGATGPREALAALATQVSSAFQKVPDGEGGYTMDHTGHIVIVNPKGDYHGFIKLPHKAETIRLTYQTLAANF